MGLCCEFRQLLWASYCEIVGRNQEAAVTSLDNYLINDQTARRRIMLISIASGALAGMLAESWGIPFDYAVIMCVAVTALVEIIGALGLLTSVHTRLFETSSVRRSLVLTAYSTAFLLLATILRTPRIVRTVAFHMPALKGLAVETELTSAERYANVGRVGAAGVHIREATDTIHTLASERAPAPNLFFASTASKLAILATKVPGEDVHQALLELAQYKTAIAQRPSTEVRLGEIHRQGEWMILKDSYIRGENAIRTGPFGTDIDGFVLDNVIFEDVTITYRGVAPVILRNVQFIDCRFNVPNTPKGDQLLLAAIQQPANVRVG